MTAIVKRDDPRFVNLARVVTDNKRSIMQALPAFMQNEKAVARFLQTCFSSIHRNPALLNCTPESFFSAARQAAMLGLPPDGAMQLAHLIPYSGTCTLQIGYKGLIELARRTGNIKSIYAYCVYPGDEFHYELGLRRDLRHVPADRLTVEGYDAMNVLSDGEVVSDSPIYGYAVAILKDDTTEFEVINRKYIDKVKKMSRSSNSKDSPWVQWEDAMIRKTAIKRVLNLIPSNPDDALSKAIALDNEPEAVPEPKHTTVQVVSVITSPPGQDTPPPTPIPSSASGSGALSSLVDEDETLTDEEENPTLKQEQKVKTKTR